VFFDLILDITQLLFCGVKMSAICNGCSTDLLNIVITVDKK
jgi:hypothetical protein